MCLTANLESYVKWLKPQPSHTSISCLCKPTGDSPTKVDQCLQNPISQVCWLTKINKF